MYYTIEDLIHELQNLQASGEQQVEVHFQASYPLKARIANVRMLDGKPVIALTSGDGYGSKHAWDDPEHDDDRCEGCGVHLESEEDRYLQRCTDCDSEDLD